MTTLSQLRTILTSAITSALILHAAGVSADDTEIFFGGPAIDEGIKPNIMFILDNSGSMNWRLDSNNNASGGESSRLTVLKDAFSDIMSNSRDLNVGVMVLNPRAEYGNSRFVYPVEYIDKELDDDIELVASTPGIRQSTDDATQAIAPVAAGALVANPTLVMGVIDSTQDIPGQQSSVLETAGAFQRLLINGTEYACRLSPPSRTTNDNCTNTTVTNFNLRRSTGNVGLFRFTNLEVPAGATITNAYLEITPTNSPDDARRNPLINVQVENSKTPTVLNDSNPVGPRTYQSAANVQANGWISGNRIALNITNNINTIKAAAPTGDPIQGVFVRLANTNTTNFNNQDYQFCANNCSQDTAPRLVISYTESGVVPEQRMGALRFQDVGIPQGATVTSARIDFIPAAANADPVTFTVRAEKVGDAPAFTNGSDLRSRNKTTALTTWAPAAWPNQPTPEPIPGPDVTGAVQEVVGLSTWCGNNAMAFYLTPEAGSTGTRSAHSFDGAGGLQPVLSISYTGGENGCFNPYIETRVTTNANDGYQAANGSVALNQETLPLSTNQLGVRFENLPIARGTEVMAASVVLTPANTINSPSQNSLISFQNSATPTAFTATNNNLSSRTARTAEVSCPINSTTGWTAGQPVVCSIDALNGALSSIFASTSWDRGRPLNMFIRHTSNSSLSAVAFDGNPGQSVKLRLKLRNGGLVRTVRTHVSALVQNMTAADGTPIVPAYWDAVRYFRNQISGRPSPINSACQANHIVMLTDGQANGTTTSAQQGIAGLAGACTVDSSNVSEQCARTLASWIASNDQSTLEGDHFITTHTVGFALDASGEEASKQIKSFLNDIAVNGGGSFNTAENASELTEAFNRIIQEVLATDTTFVSASAPANTFNRQDNKDELYFSLFRPSDTDRWLGNLKRYRMSASNGVAFIVDADGIPAIDTETGFFTSDSRSFWSSGRDGGNIALGGAASNLPAADSRVILTNVTANSNALTPLAADNTLVTATQLGANSEEERTQLINYIRGIDPANQTQRRAMGDPLHATPSLVTYACNNYNENRICTAEDQGALIGTNEGLVQLFNTTNGVERFAFMPQTLLGNIKPLSANTKSTTLKPRRYGMDNSVVVWANDINGNGVIYGGINPTDRSGPLLTGKNAGEFVYAYATMGRGGRDIYALDVTERSSPQLLWKIQGGITPGFEQLGQTWSAPTRSKIRVGSTIHDVLIFGGGYDTNQDNVSVRTPDAVGNAIYIVDARTGSLIWSASNATGHTTTLSRMQYSIPSRISVIGLQPNSAGTAVIGEDGLAGQIFFGDMGGQVWRLHVNNGESGASLITPAGSSGNGVFADVGNSDAASARRFYHEPEIALLQVDNTRVLTVSIGSGYRGHPLNKVIQDRFYSFRTDKLIKTSTNNEGTFNENSLYDATANLKQTGTSAEKTAAEETFASTNGGWYIRLPEPGEKVLSKALAADGMLLFSTYEPKANTNSCNASPGLTRAYTVSLFDATPINTTRFVETKGASLPSNPQIYCEGNSCWVFHDTSQLVKTDNKEDVAACATSANPEKCLCDRNPDCIWMPSTPKTYWIDEQ